MRRDGRHPLPPSTLRRLSYDLPDLDLPCLPPLDLLDLPTNVLLDLDLPDLPPGAGSPVGCFVGLGSSTPPHPSGLRVGRRVGLLVGLAVTSYALGLRVGGSSLPPGVGKGETKLGSLVGLVVGPPVGLIVGRTLGASFGLLVGLALGEFVGRGVGVTVGRFVSPGLVGLDVGSSVGMSVAVTVGRKVGLLVDRDDGVPVGRFVGRLVGFLVGSEVGLTVAFLVGRAVGPADGGSFVGNRVMGGGSRLGGSVGWGVVGNPGSGGPTVGKRVMGGGVVVVGAFVGPGVGADVARQVSADAGSKSSCVLQSGDAKYGRLDIYALQQFSSVTRWQSKMTELGRTSATRVPANNQLMTLWSRLGMIGLGRTVQFLGRCRARQEHLLPVPCQTVDRYDGGTDHRSISTGLCNNHSAWSLGKTVETRASSTCIHPKQTVLRPFDMHRLARFPSRGNSKWQDALAAMTLVTSRPTLLDNKNIPSG